MATGESECGVLGRENYIEGGRTTLTYEMLSLQEELGRRAKKGSTRRIPAIVLLFCFEEGTIERDGEAQNARLEARIDEEEKIPRRRRGQWVN